jgi:hypothetical protein
VLNFVEFGVLRVVVVENSVFWDAMPYSPLKVNHRFEGTRYLHLVCSLLHAGFLLVLLFNPEDIGDLFLENDLMSYMELHPRR